MMSIGLVEELSAQSENTVAYFFFQNANQELNTLESAVKGLIFGLISQYSNQYNGLKEPLRRRWDTINDRFTENCTSWRNLWNILLEMLEMLCRHSTVYLVLDALDECQDSGMADFLGSIVRNGLDRPKQLKWLLTSRPSDGIEPALLTGFEQPQVSLEINRLHVSQAVENYIFYKLNELGATQQYTDSLKEDLRTQLSTKAETTFLWVSLVCKQLESTPQENILSTIQDLPLGLHALYDQAMEKLLKGDKEIVAKCIRLLEVMMLVFRPLEVPEVSMVTGLVETEVGIEALVNRCSSFLVIQANSVQFIHQSTRDYLSRADVQVIFKADMKFGHLGIFESCLSHLSQCLKPNPLGLPQAGSVEDKQSNISIRYLQYAAVFWVRHLEIVKQGMTSQETTALKGVDAFLREKILEWFECLSLLDRLPSAIGSLETLVYTEEVRL